jgi:hypothetical protein
VFYLAPAPSATTRNEGRFRPSLARSEMEAPIRPQAAALTLAPVGTDAIVLRICEAIW